MDYYLSGNPSARYKISTLFLNYADLLDANKLDIAAPLIMANPQDQYECRDLLHILQNPDIDMSVRSRIMEYLIAQMSSMGIDNITKLGFYYMSSAAQPSRTRHILGESDPGQVQQFISSFLQIMS